MGQWSEMYDMHDNWDEDQTEAFTMKVKHETDKAVLFVDGDLKVWLPKSQIGLPHKYDIGDVITVEVPLWLADEKGL